VLAHLVRSVLDEERASRTQGAAHRPVPDVVAEIAARAQALVAADRAVINATGVILHTNLGRAPLSTEALAAMRLAAGYTDLELDLQTGERGSRQARVRQQLHALTGSHGSLIVSSNAAAVLLTLTALCRGRHVLVSRSQAVEIGGAFRVPAILRQSGARLIDVGTTNRTRLADYEDAISPKVAAILHVHASNFRIVGFTEAPALDALATMSRQRGLLLLVDNGSGAFLDTSRFGLTHEPTPREALADGADLVAFSGDKLLGGPQAGIIVGRPDLTTLLSRHPLARAVRPDKLILSALEATLQAYLRGDAVETLPIWRMIASSPAEIAARAHAFLDRAAEHGLRLEALPGESTVGGGSLPGETIPTTLLALPLKLKAAALLSAPAPVVARTKGGRVLIDLRTVAPDDETTLLTVLLDVHADLA
jgi:L-seryl-tRNA(Ser) seleniumtransferase